MQLRKYPQGRLLAAFGDALRVAFSTKDDWDEKRGSYNQYRQTIYGLRRSGKIKITTNSKGQRFLELTKKGELEILMSKSWIKSDSTWDGKWRIILFDIPEQAHAVRNKLRKLLLDNNFIILQASIYVSPFPLNRNAIDYLNATGLQQYIRIGRLEELDDDSDLKKRFSLNK